MQDVKLIHSLECLLSPKVKRMLPLSTKCPKPYASCWNQSRAIPSISMRTTSIKWQNINLHSLNLMIKFQKIWCTKIIHWATFYRLDLHVSCDNIQYDRQQCWSMGSFELKFYFWAIRYTGVVFV